jgi:hypothetical protein
MTKFALGQKLNLLDYLHRGVTLSLFAITCAGAYTLGEGSYNIISKRYGRTQHPSLPPADGAAPGKST